MLPLARKVNIVVQESGSDLLVYDLDTNRAICLNNTSSLIWKKCDGTKSPWEIGNELQRDLGVDVTEDLIWFALEQLQNEHLLESDDDFAARYAGLSRREVIRRIGLASVVALPIISSLVAPAAINAASIACVPLPLGCVCSTTTSASRPPGTTCTANPGSACANRSCRCVQAGPNGTSPGNCVI